MKSDRLLTVVKWLTSDTLGCLQAKLIVCRVLWKNPNCGIGRNVTITSPKRLTLGRNVLIQNRCIPHCGGQEWCDFGGHIVLGDDCLLSHNCYLLGAGGIEIGNAVRIGAATMIFSSGENYAMEHARKHRAVHWFEKIVLKDYANIGSGVIIVPGITVGEGSVVGAGSVVTRDIPPYVIAAGVPARVLRERE